MRAAAKELAPRRIRVNTMHPGPTSTPFQDDIEMRATGKSREEAAKDFDALIPLGRHTTPEEIAHGALPRGGRERDGHVAHVLDRRRPERLTQAARSGAGLGAGSSTTRATLSRRTPIATVPRRMSPSRVHARQFERTTGRLATACVVRA